MAGLDKHTVYPSALCLHAQTRVLEIDFADGQHFVLPCEYLRVYSPSAEVRGHGAGQDILQTGKRMVAITAIEPVGQYAVRLVFDDGHDSGLFTWPYLYALGMRQQENWQAYLARLAAAGASRDS